MRLELEAKPQNPIIIEGFPGFGFVSTIVTEFLINHLDAKQIGKIIMEELPPVIAVQKGKVIEPIGIFYSKKKNLVILHALSAVNGYEWKVADLVKELSKTLKAKDVICIEGVGSNTKTHNAFCLSNKGSSLEKIKKKTGLKELQDGIIMGVSGALVLSKSVPISCIFVETHSNLPDSRAAAKMIEVLDKYLGLKVDPKPLIVQAEKVEVKLKELMEKSKSTSDMKEKKELSYLG
jgi:uncharacterized protein (TIGR00161 family)